MTAKAAATFASGVAYGIRGAASGVAEAIRDSEVTKVALDVTGNLIGAVVPGHWSDRSHAFQSGDPIGYLAREARRVPGQVVETVLRLKDIDWTRAVTVVRDALRPATLRAAPEQLAHAAGRLDPYRAGRVIGDLALAFAAAGFAPRAGGAVGGGAARALAGADKLRALPLATPGPLAVAVPVVRGAGVAAGRVAGRAAAGTLLLRAQAEDPSASPAGEPADRSPAGGSRSGRDDDHLAQRGHEAASLASEGERLASQLQSGDARLVQLKTRPGMARTKGEADGIVHHVRLASYLYRGEATFDAASVVRDEAAFAVDRAIGTDVVPPTGLTRVDGRVASFQDEVVGITPGERPATVQRMVARYAQDPQLLAQYRSQAERVAVLDAVIGNPVGRARTLIFATTDEQSVRLAAIDNHLCFEPPAVTVSRTMAEVKSNSPGTVVEAVDLLRCLHQPMTTQTRELIRAIDTDRVVGLLAHRGITGKTVDQARARIAVLKSVAERAGSSMKDAADAISAAARGK